jgi:hypothetical protein
MVTVVSGASSYTVAGGNFVISYASGSANSVGAWVDAASAITYPLFTSTKAAQIAQIPVASAAVQDLVLTTTSVNPIGGTTGYSITVTYTVVTSIA